MPVIEHLKAVLNAELSEAAYAMAWTPGLAQSFDQALEEALEISNFIAI